MLSFLGYSHDNNCNAFTMLQRVIKEVWQSLIAHPYISTGQTKFLLKSFDHATPPFILPFFMYTLTVQSTAQAMA